MTGPDFHAPLPLLGGISAMAFMRDYWQKKPLLIRQAMPGFKPPLSGTDLRTLARRQEVESRLVSHGARGWRLRRGPFAHLPPPRQDNWTLLVQGVDLHDDRMAQLMRQFRFIPDARLDDVMVSIATQGGGVGPHVDSYDVFLLQAQGQRQWRISQQEDRELVPDLPLKILKDFRPDEEHILEPGDMLYLPPHVCHDGVALGECMTISIGFRVPSLAMLARGVLEAAADQVSGRFLGDGGLYGEPPLPGPDLSALYTDAGTPPTATPAQLPAPLVAAALQAVRRLPLDETVAARFLGQWLSNLPDSALFDPPAVVPVTLAESVPAQGRVVLDRCTRLMYGHDQLFINGEVAQLPAVPALQELADERRLPAGRIATLPPQYLPMLDEWLDEGWLHWESQE